MNKVEYTMKDKILKFFKNYKIDIGVILFVGIYISSIIIPRQLNNLDEVWIFNMARGIANGLVPYKELSIIITPGFPIICGTVLMLFGTELIVMRILAVILCTSIIYMVYKCLTAMKINTRIKLLSILGITYLLRDYFCIDYNYLILLVELICLYFEINHINKWDKLNIKYEILIGILAGFTIWIKHTLGLVFVIMFIGYRILFVRSKDDFYLFLKSTLYRFIGIIIPVILLVLYLMVNNIMHDFINYAFLGIKEFTNTVPYSELLNSDMKLLALLVPFMMLLSITMGLGQDDKMKILLFSFSIALFVMVYPIADKIHFLVGSIITFIAIIYFIQQIFELIKSIEIKDNIKLLVMAFCDSIVVVLTFVAVCSSIYTLINVRYSDYTELTNFKYISVDDGMKQSIQNVDNYLSNLDCENYIVDARAAIYMIPLNRYNKNYDMFLIGNIGYNGTQNIIRELSEKKNTKLLVVKDGVILNWQTPMDVIDYIVLNYEKVDETEYFDVYQSKN